MALITSLCVPLQAPIGGAINIGSVPAVGLQRAAPRDAGPAAAGGSTAAGPALLPLLAVIVAGCALLAGAVWVFCRCRGPTI